MNRALTNTYALLTEKAIRVTVVAVLTVMIARVLGPTEFGRLTFAQALLAMLVPLAHLGLENVVIRELIRQPEQRFTLLGTVFLTRIIAALTVLFAAVIVVAIVHPVAGLATTVLVILSLPFTASSTVDYYSRAIERMVWPAIARLAAFAVYGVGSILVLMLNESPNAIAFGALLLLEQAVLFLLYSVLVSYQAPPQKWRFDLTVLRPLLRDAWPLMLSAFSIMIYMRVDQVMIRFMLGESAAGIYSAAVTICEIWYFIPMMIMQAIFPRIIALKHQSNHYFALIERVGRNLVLLAFLFAIISTISASEVIGLIYGPTYMTAAPALSVGVWGGVFVALGVAQGPWSIAENLQKLALYRTLSGAAANVILNLALIPHLGLTGAAAATCISYAISAFIGNYFSTRTRPFFKLQLRMLLPYAR